MYRAINSKQKDSSRRRLVALLTVLALLLSMAAGCGLQNGHPVTDPSQETQTGETAETSDPEQVQTEETVARLQGVEAALPEASWQTDVRFPDWKGYVDDTLAMNGMVSFVGYHGQGSVYVTVADHVTDFSMYVNNTQVDTTEMSGGKSYWIDISDVVMNGRNTVQISGIRPREAENAVRVSIGYPEVLPGAPEEEGIAAESLQLISDLITSDVNHGFTSAQLAVVRNGRLVYENAWGRTNSYLPDGTKNIESALVTTDTLYDLASVTKMFSANYALQKLVTDGVVTLDDRIADYLGDRFYKDVIKVSYAGGVDVDLATQRAWKQKLTIRDLLQHQGGFPADPQYFRPSSSLFSGNDGSPETKAATVKAICKTPLQYEPGTKTVYSDVDYMVLGLVVEQVTGKDLNTYLKETFWEPMGLTHITYNPLENGFTKEDCAATELNGNSRDGFVKISGLRTETIQGQVHDEKAFYCMGGISGHAGLFSNASDLAKLAGVMLTGGYGENRFFSQNVIDMFTAPKKENAANWGLGWWREGDSQRVWYFGTQSGSDTIGHQGWTGTVCMIDPDRDLVIVYLTNKINSPVTDAGDDPNKFDGSYYTASTLGFVPQILSVGMDSEPAQPGQASDESASGSALHAQLSTLAADMAAESVKLIPGNAWVEHPSVKNARSKIALLSKWYEEGEEESYRSLAAELTGEIAYLKEPDVLEVEVKLSTMTTRQKVAQMLMPALRVWGKGEDAADVTELNQELSDAIRKDAFGGIILFTQNTADADQTTKLVQAMQDANRAGNAPAGLLIGVDQEGGGVTRLQTGTVMPGNMALGATGDPACAKAAARVIGRELAVQGINVNFAPVLDTNNNPSNPVIGVRSFSDNPDVVAEFGSAYIGGLHSVGVMAAVKHFPGHGDTETDSHTGLPEIDKSLGELKKCELIPFQKVLRGTDIVMTAHIRYPQIEREIYVSKQSGEEITLPATLSKKIITDLLREELGYDGVVVTDAMNMGAIAAHFQPLDAVKLAINAGVDLILMPVNVEGPEDIAKLDAYIDGITQMVENGEIAQERIDESVRRILLLKDRYGLLDEITLSPEKAAEVVGCEANRAKEWELSLRGVTVLKNQGNVLSTAEERSVVVLYPYTTEEEGVAYAIARLQEEGKISGDIQIQTVCYEDRTAVDLDDILEDADEVIAVSALYQEETLDPQTEAGAASAFLDEALRKTHDNDGVFVLISAQLPYDTARYPQADAILACYNAKKMPMLPAAIYTALCGNKASGKLPVNIPKLDAQYHYTGEMLYKRGSGM